MAKKGGLGRGLDALFTDYSDERVSALEVEIAEIEPDRQQPRSDFDEESLQELADSIREHGVLQPILLRALPGNGYKIIAGERRFRAAHLAGLTTIPAIIKDLNEQQALEAALVENLQREDLNPVEEARGYQSLIEISGITQEDAAKRVGKSRSTVTNALRLLSLPAHTVELLRNKLISIGHAKALLAIEQEKIDEVADRIVAEELSVRETEKISRERPKKPKAKTPAIRDSIAAEVEISLRELLGVEVHVKYSEGKGILSVGFYSDEQLLEFANKLGAK